MKTTRFYTLLAFLLMAGGVTMQAQNRELPTDYWKDVVTQQPSGYVLDAYDNVHLYSAEALAWLISVVNGLNGQEADDFNGKKVTLEANVDMNDPRIQENDLLMLKELIGDKDANNSRGDKPTT